MLFDMRRTQRRRSNPKKRAPKKADEYNTYVDTWFERDRAMVDLRWSDTDETIVEWWDEAVGQAVEDGFLDPSDWHGSALEYAKELGIVR